MSALAEPAHSLPLASTSSANGSSSGVAQRPHTSSSDGDDQEHDFDGGQDSSDSDDRPTQDGPGNVASDTGGGGGSRAAKRKRKNVSRACDRCRERKIKCSGECDGFAVYAMRTKLSHRTVGKQARLPLLCAFERGLA